MTSIHDLFLTSCELHPVGSHLGVGVGHTHPNAPLSSLLCHSLSPSTNFFAQCPKSVCLLDYVSVCVWLPLHAAPCRCLTTMLWRWWLVESPTLLACSTLQVGVCVCLSWLAKVLKLLVLGFVDSPTCLSLKFKWFVSYTECLNLLAMQCAQSSFLNCGNCSISSG